MNIILQRTLLFFVGAIFLIAGWGCSSGGGDDPGSSGSSGLSREASNPIKDGGPGDDGGNADGGNGNDAGNANGGNGNNGGNTTDPGPLNTGVGSPGYSIPDPYVSSTDPDKPMGGRGIVVTTPTGGAGSATNVPNISPNAPFWNSVGSGSGISVDNAHSDGAALDTTDATVQAAISDMLNQSGARGTLYSTAFTLSTCVYAVKTSDVSYGGLYFSLAFKNVPEIYFSLWSQMGYGAYESSGLSFATVPVGALASVTQTENKFENGGPTTATIEKKRIYAPMAMKEMYFYRTASGKGYGIMSVGTSMNRLHEDELRTFPMGLFQPNTAVPDLGYWSFHQRVLISADYTNWIFTYEAGPLPTVDLHVGIPLSLTGDKTASLLAKVDGITPKVFSGNFTGSSEADTCYQGVDMATVNIFGDFDLSISPYWEHTDLPVR